MKPKVKTWEDVPSYAKGKIDVDPTGGVHSLLIQEDRRGGWGVDIDVPKEGPVRVIVYNGSNFSDFYVPRDDFLKALELP